MILAEKFVFIHVPKTGGQSIHAAIGARINPPMDNPRFLVDAEGRFTFAFVRNPWARMVSFYRYLCQRPLTISDTHNQAELREMGFIAWLTGEPFWIPQDKLRGGRKLLPIQQRPQLWWADGCDFIGQFENIEQDFAEACILAGIKHPSRLPRLNATTGNDLRAEYDDASREFVAQHFAPDIERFGYGFNN